jgi:hypothetical protein
VDNVVFDMVEREHGQPMSPQQERNVSMLVHDEESSYADRMRRLASGKNALPVLGPGYSVGSRIASLQPFNGTRSFPRSRPL